jgi:hypothetical protein
VKKIPSIGLLSILFLQVAGSYIYFVVRLSGIRQEMREQIKHKPVDQLTVLTLTPEEFQRAKVDDHEVKVNGKMYDIARIDVRETSVLVYALHDEAEDNLLALLDEIVKRSSNDKKPVPSQLIQLITLIFVPVENLFPQNTMVAFAHSTDYSETLESIFFTIDTPPPQS